MYTQEDINEQIEQASRDYVFQVQHVCLISLFRDFPSYSKK